MFEQLATASDAELLAAVGELEVELSRLRYRQLAVLAELNNRNVPATLGFRGLADLIAAQARCTPVEARKRTRAVQRFGARRSLTGETLEPQYPATAEALAAGEVGSEHAAEIAEVVEAIPQPDRAEHAAHVEATLLEHARTSDPRTIRLLGRRILAHLDPDGPSQDEQRQQQAHRQVSLTPLADGSGMLEGRLSPACLATWGSGPTTASLAVRIRTSAETSRCRPPGTHLQDGFAPGQPVAVATEDLPVHARIPVPVGQHDQPCRIWTGPTWPMLPAILNDAGGVLAYGQGRRLAAPGQRKALFARDRGCTFPGCTRTAAQSEVHHALDWANGGRTDLENMAIACGYHNNEAPRRGWQTVLIDGVPHWQPPDWHPTKQPLRNYLHHPELLRPSRE